MLVREAVAELRSRLSDAVQEGGSPCWSDDDLVRAIHDQLRGIATDLAEGSLDWYVQEIELYANEAVQVAENQFLYELPPYVHQIVPDGVRELRPVTELRSSPKAQVPYTASVALGWRIDEDGMLRVTTTSPLDLVVRAIKMPARPFWATLTEGAEDPSRIVLPPAANVTGGLHVELDAYVGMRIACTSQPAGGAVAVVGESRRVVASRPVEVAGSARVELVLQRPFSGLLLRSATIESVVQVPEFALSYALWHAVLSAMSRRNRPMTDGLDRTLRTETARYMSARHADKSGPLHFAPLAGSEGGYRFHGDPDTYWNT